MKANAFAVGLLTCFLLGSAYANSFEYSVESSRQLLIERLKRSLPSSGDSIDPRFGYTVDTSRALLIERLERSLSSGQELRSLSSDLPPCRGEDVKQWTNCTGSFTYPSGARYDGEFRNGEYHGYGSFRFSNHGVKYVGQWKDGKGNGLGLYTWPNGKKYIGEHKNSKFHGQGTFIWPNGDRYIGEWYEGKRQGRGIELFSDQRPANEGIWENDVFVRAEDIPDHVISRVPTLSPPGDTVSKVPKQVRSPRVPLSLIISSSVPDTNGVITLSIATNGDTASLKINGDEEGSSADGRYNVRRFAQIGETQFEVIATDRFGNTKKQLVSVFRDAVASTVKFPPLNPSNVRPRPATNAVAIIIGIQDYRRVPRAEFANNDARLFYDYAVRGLGVRPENIKLLLDQEADDVGILGALQNWLPLKARKGQTDVYVFYSGHGLPSDDGDSLYLLPHGVDRQFLDRTAIKQSELVSALQAAKPKSVTLFMDACYSGQIRTGETLLASARPILIQPKASTFPSNFTVLTASAPDQLASSSPDLKHGVFSYYLMKGMEGEADQNKDGAITMQEMQSYLEDSVGRKAIALNRAQQPQLIGDQRRVLLGN